MKKLFSFLLFTVALLPLLTACSEDISETFHYKQSLTIKVSDRNAASATRAIHNDLVTFFTDGDKIGLFATDENGKVIAANIKATLKNNEWNLDDDIKASEKYTYYAYFPWTDNPTNSPELNSSLTSNEPDVTFKEMIDAWPILIDQSSEKNYQKSDLLLAKGIYSDGILSFAMEHKMALAVWEERIFEDKESDGINDSYTPFENKDKLYLVCKPKQQYNSHGNIVKIPHAGTFINYGKYYRTRDYSADYLTFIPVEDTTFGFTKDGLSYSLDNGETWTELAANGTTPTVAAGSKILWKNNTELTPATYLGIGRFSSDKSFDVQGNIMSLRFGDNFTNQISLEDKEYYFTLLFFRSKICKAENLILPSTNIPLRCYERMFEDCTSLTTAPELPATTLANQCYYEMFKNCTSLISAPELPATTLGGTCYAYMFEGCTSLTTAPTTLPATTLRGYCYEHMFENCTSLISAPEMPATTLAKECYQSMFQNCTSLTTAPELPAITLDERCYKEMFRGCTELTKAPQLPATTLASGCYNCMFQNCTSLTNAPELPATTLASSCYGSMFNSCTSLTKAPKLPATTLANNCYDSMFKGCTSLTKAPMLPATTLAEKCYSYMFFGCTALTTAPELPATELASSCYYCMFQNCTSLTTAPVLPATTLASNCYESMFQKCTSLTNAPELPATTLASGCYSSMFNSCTSLTKAPELPATTLADYCYNWMFYRCKKINYVKMAATDVSANGCLSKWLQDVSSIGTFVKNAAATWKDPYRDVIPSNWTVETYNP